MSKNYDPRLIKSYRSYKTKDVCRLYKSKKLHEQTVRGWVKDDGLKAFWHGKTLYIYGAVLKQFLTERNNQRKSPLAFNQFRCWKCKAMDAPLHNTVEKLIRERNKSLRAFGVCASCGHEIKRLYKADAEQEILRIFTVKHNELLGLSDSVCSAGGTHIENTSNQAVSEPPEIVPSDDPPKTTSTSDKTHIKPVKNIASIGTTHIPPTQLSLFEPL